MAVSTDKDRKDALAALSSLKRVLGIADHPNKPDEFKDIYLKVHTQDENSAILLGELLYRFATGRNAARYASRPRIMTTRDTIKIKPVEGGYEVEMVIYGADRMIKAIDKMIEKQISPGNGFSR
jgi:hypothetical protein